MENIRQAVERARAAHGAEQRIAPKPAETSVTRTVPTAQHSAIELKKSYLLSRRIIAHDGTDLRARPYDMLRTQVLRSMDLKGSKILAVTSPTPGCGKTLTAINLALSIARQPERSVLLVDLDLQKPQVANCLGLRRESGLLGVLDGRETLASAAIVAQTGNCRLAVLPTEDSTPDSSDWMASRAMSNLLQQIKRDYQSCLVVLDLPPLLSSDDVISILPQVDCALLVVAAGTSTVSEIEECSKHLQSTEVVRVVLNKVEQDPKMAYYY
jgi:Mrp family chromosome partitioning ATPase